MKPQAANSIIFLLLIMSILSSCELLAPKKWLYVTTSKSRESKNDIIKSGKLKKHLVLRGYTQQLTKEVFKKYDTTYIHTEKWFALGRISPNTMQLITREIKKFNAHGKLVYREKTEYGLLLYNSWVKKRVYISGQGTKKEKKKDYDMFEQGVP
jgi:hypothetical protein